MLRIVEAIIGFELCEQSCAEQAALCQGKAHAIKAARSAAERARYQGKNYTPHDFSTPPPSEIMKIRPWLGLGLGVMVKVRVSVSRIACGVKCVRLFSERLCIYTEAAIEGVQASVDALKLLSGGWYLKI